MELVTRCHRCLNLSKITGVLHEYTGSKMLLSRTGQRIEEIVSLRVSLDCFARLSLACADAKATSLHASALLDSATC